MRNYLKDLRRERKMPQRIVADLIGISPQNYQQIEAGQRQADLNSSTAQRLANVFEKSLTEILEFELAYQSEREQILVAQGVKIQKKTKARQPNERTY